MESSTAVAPGASAEQQEAMARDAQQADQEAAANAVVEHEGDRGLEGEGPGEEGPDPIELTIEGEGQLTLSVGGAKPETSTIRLVGGKMDIASGDFDKGASVNILIKGVVTEVAFVDTYDEYGHISGTERRHKIRPHGVERVRD